MKKIAHLAALPLALFIVACGGGGSGSTSTTGGSATGTTSYPTFSSVTDANPFNASMSPEYDNNGVLDGLYSCTLSNTGLTYNGAEFAPTLYVSVNGKSDGTTKVLIAETGDPATATIFGGVDGTVTDYTFTGTTKQGNTTLGGAVSLTFTFADVSGDGTSSPDGYMDVSATGTVQLKGTDVNTNLPYTNTANISCASVWNID